MSCIIEMLLFTLVFIFIFSPQNAGMSQIESLSSSISSSSLESSESTRSIFFSSTLLSLSPKSILGLLLSSGSQYHSYHQNH